MVSSTHLLSTLSSHINSVTSLIYEIRILQKSLPNKSAPKLKPLLVVLDIDNSRLELPGRNLAVEQNIQLAVRAALELGQTKVSRYKANASCTSPDISALA